jgi:hypothetical protein
MTAQTRLSFRPIGSSSPYLSVPENADAGDRRDTLMLVPVVAAILLIAS